MSCRVYVSYLGRLRRGSSQSTLRGNALLGKLTRVEARSSRRDRLGDLGRRLRKVDLNVRRAVPVGVNATVRPVGAAVGLGGLVHHDVADDNRLGVKALGVRVRLGVLQQSAEELDRLHGPATLRGLELLRLGVAADTTVVTAEGNDLLLLEDVLEVSVRLLERPAVDGSGSLTGVLVVNTEVVTARAGRLLRQLGIVKRVTELPVSTKNSQKATVRAQHARCTVACSIVRARRHQLPPT